MRTEKGGERFKVRKENILFKEVKDVGLGPRWLLLKLKNYEL